MSKVAWHGLARFALLLFFLVSFFPSTALGHQSSVVYLHVVPSRYSVRVTLRIANSDLYEALELPVDRPISRDEATQHQDKLARYLLSKVTVENEGQRCPGQLEKSELTERSGGFFVVDTLSFSCARSLRDATLRYELFFDLDARHQGLGKIEWGGAIREQLFRSDRRELILGQPRGVVDHVLDYLRLGVEHIFTGYDHLAFLIGLLLSVALVWQRGAERRALGFVLRVVTAFTVAHSLTLILSALELLHVPSRFVESAIALSIGWIAVENLLWPTLNRRALYAFGFGLIHGLGFASVLRELGLPRTGFASALLAFNVGVELGQLAVVALLIPILALLSRDRRVQGVVIRGGSIVLLLLSLFWFAQRAFSSDSLHP
jgi:hypothetical protein